MTKDPGARDLAAKEDGGKDPGTKDSGIKESAGKEPAAKDADLKVASPKDDGQKSTSVRVVPGITRYHRADCLLIRFLAEEDLEIMSLAAASAEGYVPCKACKPEQAD